MTFFDDIILRYYTCFFNEDTDINKKRKKSRKPLFFKISGTIYVAEAEGLEPLARGFGAALEYPETVEK